MKSRYSIALVLILLGTLFLLNNLFGLNLSVFKILLAIGFVSLGVILLSGRRVSGFGDGSLDNAETVMFGTARSYARAGSQQQTFTTIFGERTILMERIDTAEKMLYVNAYFAECTLLIPKDMPVTINGKAVFGEVNLPDGSEVNFGDRSFSNLPEGNAKGVTIYANAVFAEVKCRLI